MHSAPPAQATTPSSRPRTAQNRFGLEYRAEAKRLGAPVVPIIDAHAHINGARAAGIYREAMDAFGVTAVWSQTRLEDARAVREVMGERIRFVAVPRWADADRLHAHGEGFLADMKVWRDEFGARMVKFWTAPRIRDIGKELGDPEMFMLDSPVRLRQIERATDLGMMIMVHVADPDTWFATKYADPFYLPKERHYDAIEKLADRFAQPWMLAHFGGWPENLPFLEGLLSRHPNLHIDTSATKWMVRELSKQPREALLAFLTKFQGRVFFGSDIVTMDLHLTEKPPDVKTSPAYRFAEQASNAEEAFDLYASRYFALRTLWETGYQGESPIADPDLAMIDPGKFDHMSAPRLAGKALPRDLLRALYRDAAEGVLEQWAGKA